MKRLNFYLFSILIIAFSASAVPAGAQSTSTSNVSVTIVTPVSLAKQHDLEFLNIPLNQSAAVHAGGKMVAGSATDASFTISGLANYAFGVTMPTKFSMSVGGRTMTIGTKLRANSSNYILSTSGKGAISVAGFISQGGDCPNLAAHSFLRSDAEFYDDDADFERERGAFPVTIIYN